MGDPRLTRMQCGLNTERDWLVKTRSRKWSFELNSPTESPPHDCLHSDKWGHQGSGPERLWRISRPLDSIDLDVFRTATKSLDVTSYISFCEDCCVSSSTNGTYARILFVDFSSAFNTIIPALLQEKLCLTPSAGGSLTSCLTEMSGMHQQHQNKFHVCAIPSMAGRRIVVFPSSAELGPALARLVRSRAENAIASRGRFTLGLSGGSLVSMLGKELLALPELDCSKWLVGFCDERLVPFDDPESTYGLYKSKLFSQVNIPDSGILTIDPSLPVSQCAEDYTRKLKEAFPDDEFPVFDLLLLGMGPDGHTCSLFPDHPLLEETKKIVAPISDSPKPPPQRVTMTFPVVNAARCVAFVSTGGSKAPILKEVLEGREGPAFPAARIVPTNGELFWLVDEPAAASLTIQVEAPSSLDCSFPLP